MHESQPHAVTEPSLTDRTVEGSAARDVFDAERDAPEAVLFAAPTEGRTTTAAELATRVRALAAALIADGVGPGDRVLLMSRTRAEWSIADYAIWAAGAVTVPIYETSSAEQVAWIASDSAATAAIVETTTQAGIVGGLPEGARPRAVRCIDAGDLDGLPAPAADVAEEIRRRTQAVAPEDVATVVYTSGTTGRPKGCVLTHRNLLTNADELYASLGVAFQAPDAGTVLFLPLAHVFARMAEVACVRYRVRVAHVADTRQLPAVLAAARPTFFFAVPRVFEKMSAEARRAAAERGAIFAKLFDAAERDAIAVTRAREAGNVPSLLRLRHELLDRLVYARLRKVLGGRAGHIVSAGGPLGERLGRFYAGAGLHMMEAYGLSEALCATLNRPGASRLGSVGRPVPGSSVRVVEGEVQLRGPNIFRGYHANTTATAAVFTEDGWFRTGDLGELDPDGFLTITGREKDLIITSSGKNVSPSVLEDRLRADPLVSQAVVVGDNRPYVGVLVTLDPDVAAAEADVDGRLQRAVDHANELVSHAEGIKRFAVLPAELTESAGELTPTQKIRRAVVTERYRDAIDDLYARPRGS